MALGVVGLAVVLSALPAGCPLAAKTASEISTDCRTPSVRAFEQEVVERVNEVRRRRGGLPPLKLASGLSAAARRHSEAMARFGFFSHCDLESSLGPEELLPAAGYRARAWAENVAAGQRSPEEVMEVWMGSAGHRANILSPAMREIGVGYRFDPDDDDRVRVTAAGSCRVRRRGGPFRHYWTQAFGRRDGVFPLVIEREAAATASRRVELYVYGAGWAEEMRLFDHGEGPGRKAETAPWYPYAPEVTWVLPRGAGEKTVTVELRRGGRVLSANDSIVLAPPGG